MTNPYATIRAALESIRVCDDMTGEREAALAALAELEKASKEPVGEVESSPFGLIPAVDTNKLKRGMKLYTTPPPAPVAEICEPTPEECERICTEYERLLMREGTCGGRDAFDAVRAVMWPKSEGLS